MLGEDEGGFTGEVVAAGEEGGDPGEGGGAVEAEDTADAGCEEVRVIAIATGGAEFGAKAEEKGGGVGTNLLDGAGGVDADGEALVWRGDTTEEERGEGNRRDGWELGYGVDGCEVAVEGGLVLVAGDGGVDGARPGVDAARDGLRFVEALVPEPGGYGKGAGTVVAEDENGIFFVELLESTGGDFVHGDKGGGFNASGVILPGLADVEQERWVGGGEMRLELGGGDL